MAGAAPGWLSEQSPAAGTPLVERRRCLSPHIDMGIRFLCPNGHKLNVKSFLAGRRGVCPHCAERFLIPSVSLPNLRVEAVRKRGSGDSDSGNEAVELVQSAIEEEWNSTPQSGTPRPSSDSGRAPIAPAGPSDPLIEAPQSTWYVRHTSGQQYGPASAEQMRRWLDERRVPPDSLVWREGWPEWRHADEVFPVVRPVVAGADFDFDPDLLRPASAVPARKTAGGDWQADTAPATTLSRQERNRRTRLAVIVLAVATLALLPVLLYVLFA